MMLRGFGFDNGKILAETNAGQEIQGVFMCPQLRGPGDGTVTSDPGKTMSVLHEPCS